ncbi:MAG TPA: RusA family crossover junction endodeoxyribonuclease [Nitrospira sp.]|nr:RusA family crossover junction endodeoxyribonuclease [Nitrospira sp.]
MRRLGPSSGYISSKLPIRLPPPLMKRTIPSGAGTISAPALDPADSEGGSSAAPPQLALTLPVPPSINHQYATVRGRRLLSSAGRAYKAHVGQLVWLRLSEWPDRASVLSHLQTESLALSIRFYFTSPLRRDVDGGLKIAQDALCEGLGINDNRIVETHLYKHVDKQNPRIEILLASTRSSF